jgi:DNA polymerase III alpha subunit
MEAIFVHVNFDSCVFVYLSYGMSPLPSDDAKKPSDKQFIKTRSFLYANVDNILENLSSRRKDSLNDSDDLFGGFDESGSSHSSVSWNTQFTEKPQFNVLLEEKESLGIYVSGNPLETYGEMEEDVRARLYADNIHLALIEKVKKVFTRAGSMMLALKITTLRGNYEGIIFAKKAMEYTTVVQEKELFWILGSESKRNRKKEGEEDNEYDDELRLLIDHIVPFRDGVLKLVDNQQGFQVAVNTEDYFRNKDWGAVLSDPQKYFAKGQAKKKVEFQSQELRLPHTTSPENLAKIKSLLTDASGDPTYVITLYIQSRNGSFRRAKSTFTVSEKNYQEIMKLV